MYNKIVKNKIVIVAIVFMVIVGGIFFLSNTTKQFPTSKIFPTIGTPISQAPSQDVDFTASFEIYTLGTKRLFTQPMYHNRSENVFIQNPDPSIVYVKKSGVTWDNFFKTLPFTLTKDCLITGTKQTFCNNGTNKLTFMLSGVNTPDALDREIQKGDVLLVIYGN